MTQQIEGDGFSKLNQLFMEGVAAADKPAKIQLATVIKDAPDIVIKLDADARELDKDFLIVSERLTKHERIVSLDYVYPRNVPQAKLGGRNADTVSRRRNIGSTEAIPYENYDMQYATIRYEDVLKEGDRILVACLDADMTYIILDRAVFYE